jgi:hypothetical protein
MSFSDNDAEVKRLSIVAYKAMADDDGSGPNTVDALEALTRLFVFLMGTSCPGCRQNIAKELKRRIPRMLAEANAYAAAHPRDAHRH